MNLTELYRAHIRERQTKVAAALADTGFDALVISSGKPLRYFADDQDATFRSTPHFAHWSPCAGPGHLLIVRAGSTPKLIFCAPDDFWQEPARLSGEFWESEFDVVEVQNGADTWKTAGDIRAAAYIGDEPEQARAAGIAEDAVNPPALVALLDAARAIKSDYEILCISEAQEKATRGHRAAEAAFTAGASELEIHQAYMQALGAAERDLPYESIVALDEKSAILHYQHKRDTRNGAVLLIDSGACSRGYAADITRTYANERAHPVFRSLLSGIEKLQQNLCRDLTPGISYTELHNRAHVGIGNLLHENGIITIPGTDAFEKGITRAFFPHGLGHMLGIQVHDVGGKRSSDPAHGSGASEHLRATHVAEQGNIFTIEPGIYFIPMLLARFRSGEQSEHFQWELIDALAPFGGIRIEDDVLVTADGSRNLTREFLQ